MSDAVPIAEPTRVEAGLGLPRRIAMVFLSPVRLGETLRERAPWFWTLVPVVAIGLLLWTLLPAEVIRATMEAGMAAGGDGTAGGPTPEQMARSVRVSGTVFGTFGPLVAAAAIGGLMYVIFSVFSGLESTYRQHLSAASHIFWITAAGMLVTYPLWIVKQDMQVSLSLGLLLSDASSTLPGRVLNSITLFGLWSSSALGAIESGLSGGRIPPGRAVAIVLSLYVGWAAIAGFMSGLFPGA